MVEKKRGAGVVEGLASCLPFGGPFRLCDTPLHPRISIPPLGRATKISPSRNATFAWLVPVFPKRRAGSRFTGVRFQARYPAQLKRSAGPIHKTVHRINLRSAYVMIVYRSFVTPRTRAARSRMSYSPLIGSGSRHVCRRAFLPVFSEVVIARKHGY
jgi:hypothetical protein